MTRDRWIIICLAYIIGLLSTNLYGFSTTGFTLRQWGILAAGLTTLAVVCAIARAGLRRSVQASEFDSGVSRSPIALRKRAKTSYSIWIVATIVALLSVLYFQFRIPQPDLDDISYQVTASKSELVTVTGKVLTEPRLNDSQRLKFWLEALQINEGETVSGKLYVTLPLLQGTGVYPGLNLKITGLLYLPKAANNPGSFDFKEYLARQGIFAGIQGKEVTFIDRHQPIWGWWKLRQRIVRSQVRGLGSPVGQLVSSMVLGRKAVDLPSDLRDRFIKAGLAHVLAASGFHVSLLLGIILKLTNRLATKPRLAIGIGTLIIYLGLTGIQASVLRACLMGSVVLLALAMDTKVKPLGSLLVVAVVILLFNPLLISDLGFQLSFLATLGLIITLPQLQAKLDWLPPTLATLIAVPLAASVWVLPLLCYVFNTLAVYSIVVNILCTPLITIVSLGGMISAIAALLVPALGSAIASLLFYPTLLLITVTEFFTNLPGSTWAVGQISFIVLSSIYGLIALVWLNKWWRSRWWLAGILAIALITIPIINNFSRVQVTVLAARESPTIIVQDRGEVILVDSGNNDRAKYTVLPFLAQQGINQIDYAIDYNPTNLEDWNQTCKNVRIKHFVDPASDSCVFSSKIETIETDTIVTKSARINVNRELGVFNLQIADNTWLIIDRPPTNNNPSRLQIEQYIKQHNLKVQHPILVWSGSSDPDWLELLQPQTAIAPTAKINPKIKQELGQKQIELINLAEGMIRWTPEQKFISKEVLY